MLSKQQSHDLAVDAVSYILNNKINFQNKKRLSNKNPRYSDEFWAKLMTEAISSFYEGLDLDTSNNKRANSVNLYKKALNLVGDEAFNTIAFVVAAAGVRRPIEEEVEQSFEQLQMPGEQVGIETPWQNLPDYIVNESDQAVWGQISSHLVSISSQRQTQPMLQQTGQMLQRLSTTPGVSQEFAQALASVGAQYQIMADESTRESLITRAEKEVN